MINFHTYPLNTPSLSKYNSLIQTCREQLSHRGFVSLKNFLDPSHVDSLVSNILSLEKGGAGFDSKTTHNVFLEDDDTDADAENNNSLHPRRIRLKSSKTLIHAKDLAPYATELDTVFHSRTFLSFIGNVLEMTLYPSADEYGKYYANIFQEGDGLDFHFDVSEFSISLILKPAEEGGKFQFVPNSRKIVEEWEVMPLERIDLQLSLDAASPSKSMMVHEPELASGDLYLFRGRDSLHRVTEVTRGKRINVILTFNTEPDVVLNNYTLERFFGVT